MTNHPMRNWQRRWINDPAARAVILREWRNTRKITQRQLAEILPCSKRCIEEWEGGRRIPPAWLYRALKNIG